MDIWLPWQHSTTLMDLSPQPTMRANITWVFVLNLESRDKPNVITVDLYVESRMEREGIYSCMLCQLFEVIINPMYAVHVHLFNRMYVDINHLAILSICTI